MSTITTICNAFQTINAAVSGVTTAPAVASYPATLTPDKLPIVITLPGQAVWPPGGGALGGLRKCERTYVIRAYLAAVSDPDVGTMFVDANALLEALGTTYRALRTVGGATLMFSGGTGMEDLGFLRTLRYAGVEFYGMELRIPVTEPS